MFPLPKRAEWNLYRMNVRNLVPIFDSLHAFIDDSSVEYALQT